MIFEKIKINILRINSWQEVEKIQCKNFYIKYMNIQYVWSSYGPIQMEYFINIFYYVLEDLYLK